MVLRAASGSFVDRDGPCIRVVDAGIETGFASRGVNIPFACRPGAAPRFSVKYLACWNRIAALLHDRKITGTLFTNHSTAALGVKGTIRVPLCAHTDRPFRKPDITLVRFDAIVLELGKVRGTIELIAGATSGIIRDIGWFRQRVNKSVVPIRKATALS